MDVRFYKEIKNRITTSSRLLKDSKETVVFLKEKTVVWFYENRGSRVHITPFFFVFEKVPTWLHES
jgi:hypothetical protein